MYDLGQAWGMKHHQQCDLGIGASHNAQKYSIHAWAKRFWPARKILFEMLDPTRLFSAAIASVDIDAPCRPQYTLRGSTHEKRVFAATCRSFGARNTLCVKAPYTSNTPCALHAVVTAVRHHFSKAMKMVKIRRRKLAHNILSCSIGVVLRKK